MKTKFVLHKCFPWQTYPTIFSTKKNQKTENGLWHIYKKNIQTDLEFLQTNLRTAPNIRNVVTPSRMLGNFLAQYDLLHSLKFARAVWIFNLIQTSIKQPAQYLQMCAERKRTQKTLNTLQLSVVQKNIHIMRKQNHFRCNGGVRCP